MSMIKTGDKMRLKNGIPFMSAGTIYEVLGFDGKLICLESQDVPDFLPKGATSRVTVNYEGLNECFELVTAPKRKYGEYIKFDIKEYLPAWFCCEALDFCNKYEYRTDGKRVQVKGTGWVLDGPIKATASCMDSDEFNVKYGIELACLRLVKKLVDDDIKDLLKD